ncbi:MAG: flagellar assembly peptidoglycan hydrolase FlgJ [Burkholderiaceae bacterium]
MALTPTQGLAADAGKLASLRNDAARDPKTAAKEAAKQFEAIFMQELLKSMRAATMQSGLLDNETSKLGTEMLDGQLAMQFSGRPGGLSELIARQLERQMGAIPGAAPKTQVLDVSVGSAVQPERQTRIPDRAAAAFVKQHEAAAREAERSTGIPAAFMLAQAAHESGWGQREIRLSDGSSANNLFGIKAGAGWKGAVAEVTTTEYVNGTPQRVQQKFRAYASAAESFADYAALMKSQPRYQAVLDAGGDARAFAQGLQRAGYATDPRYADKLVGVIQTTLRLQQG